MRERVSNAALAAVISIGLAGCLAGCDWPWQAQTVPQTAAGPAVRDPVMARALHDPLMTDPDLAWRSEANGVIAMGESTALPVIEATTDSTQQARGAARSAVTQSGATLPPLPEVTAGSGGAALAGIAANRDLLAALNAPEACASAARQGFGWAAKMPDAAAIMPLGMAQAAAGTDIAGCRLRLVRYVTAAGIEDALNYHAALAGRAGMQVTRFAEPEAILTGRGGMGEELRIHLRAASGGMTAVDVAYWVTP